MTVAELFVSLTVKGADVAGKALGGVKGGLNDVKNMSLEAKAAIIGTIYALERMMSSSAKAGTDLTNFNTVTGVSAQSLQKWQYAAQQANNSASEVAGSVKSVQDNMLKMLQGGGAPQGWAQFEQFMSSIGENLTGEKIRDMDYMLHAIQKFANAGPVDVMKDKVKSLGVSENTFAAMRLNAFRPDVYAKAPAFSDGQLKQLSKVDIAWANLGTKVKMAFGNFTAKDGMKIVEWISLITDKVIKLADVVLKLADRFKIFEGITAGFQLMGDVLDKVAEFGKTEDGNDSNFFKMINSTNWGETKKHAKAWLDEGAGPSERGERNWSVPNIAGGKNQSDNKVQIQQTNVFQHDGKDPKKTEDSHRKAAVRAYQQIPAVRGGQ